MKTWFTSCLAVFFPLVWAQADGTYQVPPTIAFAGLTLELSAEARESVQKSVDHILANASNFNETAERSSIFFPELERMLEAGGVPGDFKYLALQESQLKANTVAHFGAAGYWQLKVHTARELGLRVSAEVDERKHLYTATQKVALYLKNNQALTQNWLVTLLAYRIGLEHANKYFEKHDKVAHLHLGKDTHHFIIHFLAYKLAYGPADYAPPSLRLAEYPAGNFQDFASLAQHSGLSESAILIYNQWLRVKYLPSAGNYTYILPLPAETAEATAAKLGITLPPLPEKKEPEATSLAASGVASTNNRQDTQATGSPAAGTPAAAARPGQEVPYPEIKNTRVEKIENVSVTLCDANGIPAFLASAGLDLNQTLTGLKAKKRRFMRHNDLSLYDDLIAERIYYLRNKKAKGVAPEHVAMHGETLWDVSQMYAIRLRRLKRLNRIGAAEEIVPGRVLLMQRRRKAREAVEIREVPKALESTDPAAPANTITVPATTTDLPIASDATASEGAKNERFHIVREGETLNSIAARYGVGANDLKAWNDLPDNMEVSTGKILIVKGGSPQAGAADEDRLFDPFSDIVLIDDEGNTIGGKSPTYVPSIGGDGPATAPEGSKTHKVAARETLYGISLMYGVTTAEIVAWNGLKNTSLSIGQELLIGKSSGPVAARPARTEASPANNSPTPAATAANVLPEAQPQTGSVHTVQAGETLYALARTYQINVRDLAALNGLTLESQLRTGQQIVTAQPQAAPARVAVVSSTNSGSQVSSSPSAPAAVQGYHSVTAGETVFAISRMHGITPGEVREWNNLPPNANIKPGDRLVVDRSIASRLRAGTGINPQAGGISSSGSTASKSVKTHKVKKGETLFGISQAYKVSVADLMSWNNLREGSINVGQELMLGPGGNRAATSTPNAANVNIDRASVNNNPASGNVQPSSPANNPVYHTVKKGETLYSISVLHKTTVRDIKILNQKQDDNLRPNTQIRVK